MSLYTQKLKLTQWLANLTPVYFMQPLFNACFYGLKSFFTLYIIHHLGLTESEAVSAYGMFMALCYGTTLAGGYLGDQGLGVKNSILLGGILSILGVLCFFFPSKDLCFIGLSLFSVGSGLFKPNLMTAVGLTFEDPKDPQKDKLYSSVYVLGNGGILILTLLCAFAAKAYGWHYALAIVAGVLTGATWLVYKSMRFHPSYQRPALSLSTTKSVGIAVLLVLGAYPLFMYQELFKLVMAASVSASVIYMARILYQCQAEERKAVWSVVGYILPFSLFVSLFEQSGSSFLLFLERAVDREVMGMTIPAPAVNSLNPLFVLICGFIILPLCNRYLERSKPLNGLTKMGCGFLLAVASFWILASGCGQEEGVPVPLLCIMGAFFFQTLGELWIAPVSLSKISKSAPNHLQGVMMSFWTMAIAYGHYFAGIIAQFSINPATSTEGFLEHYQTFFFSLGLIALGGGVALLGCRVVKARFFPATGNQN